MKGAIRPNHMAVNKYTLLVVGMPPLTPTEVSGIEEELNVVDLPDRTRASGGNTNPVEFTIKIPAHHTVETLAMAAWFRESKDPVLPTYKKPGVLMIHPIGPGAPKVYQLTGMFPTKKATPDLAMSNDGEMAEEEWTISADDIAP